MPSIKSFMESHSVAIYFLLTFAFSWGCMAAMISPHSFPLTPEQSEAVGPFLYVGMLVGPSFSGLLLTGLVDGKAGYRRLISKLTKWRVKLRWYAAVLLGTPILATLVLLALSLYSPEFTPALFTTDDKTSLLTMGIGVGLMVGVFEEIGWTGFVVPQLRQRYGIRITALFVGLLWGLWHFPHFWELNSFSGMFPMAVLLTRLFAWLPPFRILMVWVHDKTESLSLTMLLHASLVFSTLVLPSMTLSAVNLLIWLITWGAVLWGTVAALTR